MALPAHKQHKFLSTLLKMKSRTLKEALWRLETAEMYYKAKLEGK